jgi:hypothetical protein
VLAIANDGQMTHKPVIARLTVRAPSWKQILRKIWPCHPDKSRTTDVRRSRGSGKTRSSKHQIQKKDSCTQSLAVSTRPLSSKTASSRYRSHAIQRRKLLPFHADSSRSGGERPGFNTHRNSPASKRSCVSLSIGPWISFSLKTLSSIFISALR